MKARFLSVSTVNSYIKSLIEEDALLDTIFVRGEISNFTHHSSGHLYFSLKDEFSSISCVMFSQAAKSLNFSPSNGMSVMIYGRIGLYEKYGRCQLYAEVMEDVGVGKLYAMFEALKAKLQKKGYFDVSRKKPLPPNPETVALVTSPTGAAIRDMIRIAKHLNPGVAIVVAPCLVQGADAPLSIAKAIGDVNRWGGADIIIAGRGGGSTEDLWAFNEEIVAEAIYSSKIPVVSAVGHETDFTIADFTADVRASTPSSAISMAIPHEKLRRDRLTAFVDRLNEAAFEIIDQQKNRLKSCYTSRGFERANMICDNYRIRLSLATKALNKEAALRIEKYDNRLKNIALRLDTASPLQIINKGYALVFSEKKPVRDIKEIAPGQEIIVKLTGGSFSAEVTKLFSEDIDGGKA